MQYIHLSYFKDAYFTEKQDKIYFGSINATTYDNNLVLESVFSESYTHVAF